MTPDLLSALTASSLAATAAILVVLLVRRPARHVLGARAAYSLWLAVPIAAATVLAPRPAAIVPQLAAPIGEMAEAARLMFFDAPAGGAMQAPFNPAPFLLTLWLGGAAIFLVLTLLAHRKGVASFGALRLEDGVLRASGNGLGPALIGGLWPKLVLPADFEARFEPQEQALVLAHERAHLAGGDTYINTLMVLFICLNWFNPLVHLAARLARVDQELACDAAVAARFPGERRTYARALLKTQLAPASLPLGCYWPGRSSKLLTERIEMLAFKTSPIRSFAGGVAFAALCAGAGLTAWAVGPEQVRAAPATTNATAPAAPTVAAPAPAPESDDNGPPTPEVVALPGVRISNAELGHVVTTPERAAVRNAVMAGNAYEAMERGGTVNDAIDGLRQLVMNDARFASIRDRFDGMLSPEAGNTLTDRGYREDGVRMIRLTPAQPGPTGTILINKDGTFGVAQNIEPPRASATPPASPGNGG